MSSRSSRIMRNPPRTSAWSSAISDPDGHAAGLEREPGVDPVAAVGPRSGLERAAQQRRPLAHADQPVTAAAAVGRGAAPVVAHVDLERSGP